MSFKHFSKLMYMWDVSFQKSEHDIFETQIFVTWNGISKFFLYEDMLYLLFGKQYDIFKSCESSCDHRLGGNGFYMKEFENKGNACYITHVTNKLWLSNYAMIRKFLSDLLIHFLQSLAKIKITKGTIIYFKRSNYMIGNVCYILKWPFGFWLKSFLFLYNLSWSESFYNFHK
jgi:hypothetical protein